MVQRQVNRIGERLSQRCELTMALNRGLGIWLGAAGGVLLALLIQSGLLFNLADEGFLWYGVWRTGLGDIPVRDFQAYEPGRYYFCALLTRVFGEGPVGLRYAVGVFQFLTAALGLLALRRVVSSLPALWLTGAWVLAWMVPWYKAFEPGIALAAVYVVLLLFEFPSARRFFLGGLFVGLAAFFGQNHGVYIGLAVLAAVFLAGRRDAGAALRHRLGASGLGLALAILPLLSMALWVEGFWDGVLRRFEFISSGATNLLLPVPWPWRTEGFWTHPGDFLQSLAMGLLFLVVPLSYLAVLGRAAYRAIRSGDRKSVV